MYPNRIEDPMLREGFTAPYYSGQKYPRLYRSSIINFTACCWFHCPVELLVRSLNHPFVLLLRPGRERLE